MTIYIASFLTNTAITLLSDNMSTGDSGDTNLLIQVTRARALALAGCSLLQCGGGLAASTSEHQSADIERASIS